MPQHSYDEGNEGPRLTMPLGTATTTSPSKSLCWELLASMLRIRAVEERIATCYSDQRMRCPVHLSIGQEGPAAAFGSVLRREDLAMSGHRSHAHYLAKGGSLDAMIAEMHGKVTGCSKGRGGSMHLTDSAAGFVGAVPIVGSTLSVATGLAFADKQLARQRVTAAFFGDAAAEEGVFHESLNFAMLHRLPIIYVCENNLYSVYSPLSVRQSAQRSLCDIARGHGLIALPVDGNDVFAAHGAATQARQLAMEGQGPVFVELATYRWREHCGPGWDNHIGYRTESEFGDWKARDPIVLLEDLMSAKGWADAVRRQTLCTQHERELETAFASAEQAPFPAPETFMDHILA